MHDPVEVMKPPLPRKHTVGLLEMLFFVVVLLLGVCSAIGLWTFNLLILLLLLAVVYGVLRDVRALARLKTSDGPARAMPLGRNTGSHRCVQLPTTEN